MFGDLNLKFGIYIYHQSTQKPEVNTNLFQIQSSSGFAKDLYTSPNKIMFFTIHNEQNIIIVLFTLHSVL